MTVELEHRVGRLLAIATVGGVTVLALGVIAMAAAGISPLDPSPAFDLAAVPGRIGRLEPVALLWLGLVIVIATPPIRVAAALYGFARGGERRMVLIALAVLALIAAGIAAGLSAG